MLTAAGEARPEEGDAQGAQGDGVAHRQGDDRRGLQGNRLRSAPSSSATSPGRRRDPSGGPFVPALVRRRDAEGLDHLEEWLISFLMGAATLIIFVAVVHRYASGAADPRRAGLGARAQLQLGAGAVHLHVRLDGEVRRGLRRAHRHPRRRRRPDQPAERAPSRASSSSSACSPAPRSPPSSARSARPSSGRTAHTRSQISVAPTSKAARLEWIVYLGVPLGSYLMCFRFLQVTWTLPAHRRAAAPRPGQGRRHRGAPAAGSRARQTRSTRMEGDLHPRDKDRHEHRPHLRRCWSR